MNNRRFGAVILAAGFSSRMGSFKPLLELNGESILERLIKTAQMAGLKDIIVVTGYNRENLEPVIKKYGAKEAFNSDYARGMFSSIQSGALALPDNLDGFFLMPVDCPMVTRKIMLKMMDLFEENKFSVACYRGKKGHPLLIPECFRREIMTHDGQGGLKTITDRDFDLMNRIETGFEGIVMDMDTPEAYENIKKYLANGCKEEKLQKRAQGRRFILVRHGQIQQHEEKIFLGQTDVPLSETGKQQAMEAAEKLADVNLKTERIYTSDLKRAFQTAEILQKKNSVGKLIPVTGFREMNLGPWDGKFISEIKNTMPEEFEKRGKHLMIYKMGHESENFFDLQYRVNKTLIDLLKNDSADDIVITAHSGVLRVICNNLKGKDVSEDWDKLNNGEIRIINL